MLPRGLRAMRALRLGGLGRCPLGRAFADDAAKATATATATAATAAPGSPGVNPKTSGLPMTTPGAPGAVRPRVVIVGTGWASFRVLADIDTKKNDVTVISPRNHLLFTPMLASSALGTVNQRSICQPVRPLTAKKNATYYESSVVGVDKEKQLVTCKTLGGQEYNLPYDKLVVGIGFQPNDFNIPGVKENALFMKETADATRFKDHVLEKLEEAAYCHALDNDLTLSDEEKWKIQELLTFIVVGGGPTGVELAGELTDFLYNEVANLYKNLKPYIHVHMFTYDLLNTFDEKLQDYAITHLRKKQNVQVHLGAFVQKVEPNVVHVKLGESAMSIRYGTLVWCAGIKPHPFVSDFGFAMNDKGSQILVDPFLKVKGEKNIYAIGDCATIEDYWLPQTAQVANQQGQYLAKALGMDESKTKPFEFHNKGTMAYLGGLTAIMANLPGVSRITGFVAFLGWRFTYWFLQLSMRNRFMLVTDWLRTFIFGRDLTRFGPRSKPT